jgi:putative zinc finger/helix-turn-helix YgiT family protein
MKSLIDCPFCDGSATLRHERRPIIYRNESLNVAQAFYQCHSCKEAFTTTESDTFSINQLHAQYRAQHKIPFSEELLAIRSRYGLSAKRMSQLLGLGDNTYGLYEKGDMPTLANANLIKISAKPASFYTMVEDMVTEKERQMINRAHTENVTAPMFNIYNDADEMTGFRRPDFNRTTQVLSYFLSKSEFKYNSPLKLNKILFYTDLVCYRETGRSMMGLSYRAAPHGPVPSRYDTLFAELKNQGYLNATTIDSGYNVIEIFEAQNLPNMSIFSREETIILDKIVATFAQMTPKRIRDISHEEKAWIERNVKKELISYPEYAFSLVAI